MDEHQFSDLSSLTWDLHAVLAVRPHSHFLDHFYSSTNQFDRDGFFVYCIRNLVRIIQF